MRRASLALIVLLLAHSAHAAGAGDAARGEVVAKVRCAPCHFLDRTTKRIGPGLAGVYGRAPTITGVPFRVWDRAALDRWLKNPRAVKPNTKMQIPPISERDRRDVIAWLAAQAKRSVR